MANWAYGLSQGIAAGAQSAGGLIDAQLKEEADQRAADRRLSDQERLLAAQEAMQERIAEASYQRQQRPNQAAGALLTEAGQQQLPAKPEYGNNTRVNLSGNPEEVEAKINAIRNDPNQTADSRELVAAYDAQKQAESDAVGKTRAPTREEQIQIALDNAIKRGDAVSYERLKTLAGDQYTAIPEGGLLNRTTGEVIAGTNARAERERANRDQDYENKSNLQREKIAAAVKVGGLLPDDVVEMMAQQYRAGDTSVMQNLGRGAQGSENIVKLRNAIARQAQENGEGGVDLAAKNAEFMGTKAGQRAAGTRIANVEMAVSEAQNLIPLALAASEAVDRSGLLPFGKAQVMFNEQTNSPEMRQFAAANNALVNVYSRAISPTGQPTISDKDHARELLSTAYDQPSYKAVVKQMQLEMEAAQRAPQQVREAFNSAVTGRGGHSASSDQKPAAGATQPQIPAGWSVKVK